MKRQQALVACSLIGVQIAGFIIFYLFPMILSIVKSLDNGGIQYVQLLSTDAFYLALKNTAIFLIIGVPLLLILSFEIALGIKRLSGRKKLVSALITLHLLPMIIPSSVIAFVFNSVLNRQYPFLSLMFIFIWKNYGYCMIVLLGGISSIPDFSIEAAKLDGAGNLTIIRKIVLPQMRNYITFAVMMEVVGLFKVFRESYMMYGNYPDESVYMLQNFMNNCFYSLNYNRLAASSTIVVLILLCVVALVVVRGERDRI